MKTIKGDPVTLVAKRGGVEVHLHVLPSGHQYYVVLCKKRVHVSRVRRTGAAIDTYNKLLAGVIPKRVYYTIYRAVRTHCS